MLLVFARELLIVAQNVFINAPAAPRYAPVAFCYSHASLHYALMHLAKWLLHPTVRLLHCCNLFCRSIAWDEAIGVGCFLLFLHPGYVWLGLRQSPEAAVGAWLGLGLVLVGSWLNTWSELDRHLWKLRPEHRGQGYTGGLWQYAVHINYFGDVVLFSGWTLLTATWCVLRTCSVRLQAPAVQWLFGCAPESSGLQLGLSPSPCSALNIAVGSLSRRCTALEAALSRFGLRTRAVCSRGLDDIFARRHVTSACQERMSHWSILDGSSSGSH